MTTAFTDEQLAAFLEGRLDETLAAAIETAINAEPALADRAEKLSDNHEIGALAQRAFAPVLDTPVPPRLIAATESGNGGSRVVSFARPRRHAVAPENGNSLSNADRNAWRWPQFTALAASLAIGAWLGGNFGNGGEQAKGNALILASAQGPVAPRALNVMLDTASSGEPVQIASLGTAEVVISFRTMDQGLCRQLTIDGGAGVSDALACRSDGQWQIEAFGRRSSPIGEMRTAGGDASKAVLAVVDELIAGDVLVGEDERSALDR